MATEKEQMSASESLRKTRTFGKVRCHNPSCMERIQPAPGANHAKCPTCGMEYRLFWVNPTLPQDTRAGMGRKQENRSGKDGQYGSGRIQKSCKEGRQVIWH